MRNIRFWLYDNARWFYNIINPVISFCLNYYRDHTHIFYTGVKRGQWADKSYRLSYVLRNEFLNYCEDELYDARKCEEYDTVLKVLKWEEKHNHVPNLVDTYKYVKYRRDQLIDLEKYFLNLGYSIDSPLFDEVDEYTRLWRDQHCLVEEHLYMMDNRYLHRIVDIIPYMWT